MKYVAVQEIVSISQLSGVIGRDITRVAGWLAGHNAAPSGPPFVRYISVNMPSRLRIHIGFPVAKLIKVADGLTAGMLPAGRYVSTVFTGPYAKIGQATGDLMAWVSSKHLRLREDHIGKATLYNCRLETYLTNPAIVRDPNKQRTDIAILLAK